MTGLLPNIKEGFATFKKTFYNYEADMAQRMIGELFNDSVLCDEIVIESVLVIRGSSRSRKDS